MDDPQPAIQTDIALTYLNSVNFELEYITTTPSRLLCIPFVAAISICIFVYSILTPRDPSDRFCRYQKGEIKYNDVL